MNLRIPLFDFKQAEQAYQRKVDKQLLDQNSPGALPLGKPDKDDIIVTIPTKVNNKGHILVENFHTVGVILKSIIGTAYSAALKGKELSGEEKKRWDLLLSTDWASKTLETAGVFNKFIINNGVLNGTSRFKDQAQCAIARTEGVKVPVNFAIDKEKHWPTKLNGLKLLLVEAGCSTKQISDQLLRTIVGVSRLPEDYSAVNIETIIQKRVIKRDILREFDVYVAWRINDIKSGLPNARGPEFTKWDVRPSAKTNAFGPNGMLKLFTAGLEAAALIGSPLNESFKKLCVLTGNASYYDYVVRQGQEYHSKFKQQCELNKGIPNKDKAIDVIAKLTPSGKAKLAEKDKKKKSFLLKELAKKVGVEKARALLNTKDIVVDKPVDRPVKPITMFTDPSTASLRTITAVKDTGNKSRTIAIVDTWTQLLLTPFEDKIIVLLRSMFGRTTSFFDHQKGFKKFKSKIRPGIKSIDLKSWTDFLNSRMQKSVAKHVFGEDIANCWYELVVDCEWQCSSVQGKFKYGTGQGMGTKGSFAIASVTDHFLSEMLLNKFYPEAVRDNPIEDLYNRVGDDLWIWDPRGLISQALVEDYKMVVNESKSKTATTDNIVGEYVSMNINYGMDVSRISIRNMLDLKGDLYAVIPLIHHLSERMTVDTHTLLRDLYLADEYPKKVWSNFFKGICLETIVSSTDDPKEQIRQALIKLNAEFEFSEHGPEPYGELRSHPDAEYIMLILMVHNLKKDALGIKSQILRLHSIRPETVLSWREAWVQSKKDHTIWDTKLQLHELITWMQYVDSTDHLDSLDPDTIVFQILMADDIGKAYELLYHYRDLIEKARSQLTFQNINRLIPMEIENRKTRQYIKLSNSIVVDNYEGFKVLKIIDEPMVLDEFINSAIGCKIRDIVPKLYVVSNEDILDSKVGLPITVFGPHPKPDNELLVLSEVTN